MRKSASEDFFSFESKVVLKYVKWDLYKNTLFCIGPLVMAQGKRGVPIGGFISAQCTELWCMYKEYLAFTTNAETVSRQWNKVADRSPAIPNGWRGSVSEVIHFHPPNIPNDLSRKGDVWANDFRHLATLENVKEDFTSWRRPTEKMFAQVGGGGYEFPVLFPTQWDGCPWCRVNTIVRSAPKRDQGLLY